MKQPVTIAPMIIWIAIAVIGRVMPHLANITPVMSLTIIAASLFSRKTAMGLVIISMIISDTLLAYFNHYSAFGSWTLFTYSALLIITWSASHMHHKYPFSFYLQGSYYVSHDDKKQNHWLIVSFAKRLWHDVTKNGHFLLLLMITLAASLSFWLWTNFGTWLLSTGYYYHNLHGLLYCYINALPFLQRSLLGDIIYLTIIYSVLSIAFTGSYYYNVTKSRLIFKEE